MLLGGWVRDFGVKLLNRVDIQKFFFHYPLYYLLFNHLFRKLTILSILILIIMDDSISKANP
jgi:hypothetical protein